MYITNVPLIETVDYICQEITERQMDLEIPLCGLKELLLKCTMNVYFVFNNSYHRQVDGIAMGSSLGPTLADCILAKLENGRLGDVIKELDMYYGYVDDTFILVDGNANIDELLVKFDNIHPLLTFTCEEEQDSKLHFLNVWLNR
ncbi:unnamed protein product [Trichobilharzia szidati]|nr:unnamed protein product [Trichobilharzia szidati]